MIYANFITKWLCASGGLLGWIDVAATVVVVVVAGKFERTGLQFIGFSVRVVTLE